MHLLLVGVAIGIVIGHLVTVYWPDIVRKATKRK